MWLFFATVFIGVAAVSSAHAQKGKGLSKALDAAVGRQVAQTAIKPYSPVFGYTHLRIQVPQTQRTFMETTLKDANASNFIITAFGNYGIGRTSPLHDLDRTLIQVAPVLDVTNASPAFVEWANIGTPQLVQGLYLWRLAHPGQNLDLAAKELKELGSDILRLDVSHDDVMMDINEYPNILFLDRLMDNHFTPKTYVQLARETKVYPKHIRLNADGFPVATVHAQQARMLDNYLMLSNPDEMWSYDNTFDESGYWGEFNYPNQISRQYTPFVLTKEEKAAADQLLALRQKNQQIPANPTPRQLLALGYNELAADMAPYTKVAFDDSIEVFIRAALKKSELNDAISKAIQDYRNRENPQRIFDLEHLIVLNAILGNVHPHDVKELHKVLDSFFFMEMSEIAHKPENFSHLITLHKILPKITAFADYDGEYDPDIYLDDEVPVSREEYEGLNRRLTVLKNFEIK